MAKCRLTIPSMHTIPQDMHTLKKNPAKNFSEFFSICAHIYSKLFLLKRQCLGLGWGRSNNMLTMISKLATKQ